MIIIYIIFLRTFWTKYSTIYKKLPQNQTFRSRVAIPQTYIHTYIEKYESTPLFLCRELRNNNIDSRFHLKNYLHH